MRVFLLFATLFFFAGCSFFDNDPEVLRLSGDTMGTTYNITVVDAPENVDEDTLSAAIEAMLAIVNSQMSNWDKNSEVSRFNTNTSTEPLPISAEFATVMLAASEVHSLSGGKFDVTLAPLINLWGFGPKKPGEPIPSDTEISAALTNVGQSRVLTLSESPLTLQKSTPGVSVNLSAIAKGYGVDQLAAVLRDQGIENYLVEIGGDLVAAGLNENDEAWVIGIEKPNAASQTVQLIVPVSDLGMATSGDYRNYFEKGGIRYSHIIDPTVGRPISHRTTSVTVLAENAMLADALATAMLVVGAEEGLALAEANDLAVFFISRQEDEFMTAASRAFEKHLEASK